LLWIDDNLDWFNKLKTIVAILCSYTYHVIIYIYIIHNDFQSTRTRYAQLIRICITPLWPFIGKIISFAHCNKFLIVVTVLMHKRLDRQRKLGNYVQYCNEGREFALLTIIPRSRDNILLNCIDQYKCSRLMDI
jgi:hypothetical protein